MLKFRPKKLKFRPGLVREIVGSEMNAQEHSVDIHVCHVKMQHVNIWSEVLHFHEVLVLIFQYDSK